MISTNIDIFEMDYEEAVAYFIHLENLEKICHTNGPAPTLVVDNQKTITSRVKVGKFKKSSKMWCHYCDKNNHNMADCREITKAKQQKKTHSEANRQ